MVERHIGTNDYQVNAKRKAKTYHINLLKRYHQRKKGEKGTAIVATGRPLLDIVSATIIENSEPNLYEAKGHARTRRPQETSASENA